jgi:uncharacterized protein (TIGR03000 family)
MYSVVLSALVGLGTAAPDCHKCRHGQAGCAGCGSSAGYAGGYAMPATMMPSAGCGCASCGCNTCGPSPYGQQPDFGGMPMGSPMGEMNMPPMGMAMPPGDGMLLPPSQLGAAVPPPGMPPMPPQPALGEARTSPNQAMFVVTLPENARLVADGTVIPGIGPVRVFVTPPLDPAREYFYELAIEVDRGGKVLRDQQTVKFQAGKTANVSFAEPKAETPAPPPANAMPKTARIRVRMPDGATLFVEGQPWAVPVIQTPPLDPSQTHYYQLRAEVVRNGRLTVVTREVAFRAGQEVIVDLTSVPLAQIAKTTR